MLKTGPPASSRRSAKDSSGKLEGVRGLVGGFVFYPRRTNRRPRGSGRRFFLPTDELDFLQEATLREHSLSPTLRDTLTRIAEPRNESV